MKVLFLDCSTDPFHVGLLRGKNSLLISVDGPILSGLFPAIEHILHASGVTMNDITSFLCCIGPGGLMGLRLCKMFVDAMVAVSRPLPLFGFDCLSLAGKILSDRGEKGTFAVATAIGRHWAAVLPIENGQCIPPIRRMAIGELGTMRTYVLPSRFPPIPGTQPFFWNDREILPYLFRLLHGDGLVTSTNPIFFRTPFAVSSQFDGVFS
jgi:hypothetical protein